MRSHPGCHIALLHFLRVPHTPIQLRLVAFPLPIHSIVLLIVECLDLPILAIPVLGGASHMKSPWRDPYVSLPVQWIDRSNYFLISVL